MTAAAQRETIVEAIIDVARNDALSDDERVHQVSGLMAEMQVCRVTDKPVRVWLHHPLMDDVVVHYAGRRAPRQREAAIGCGND